MSQGWLILVGWAALGTAIFWIDLQLKRRRGHRPLSHCQPEQEKNKHTPNKELGLEALDLDMVDKVNKENKRIQRIHDEVHNRTPNRHLK